MEKELAGVNDKEVVAVDGKTIRGAKHKGRKSPCHLVSAWADQQNLVLGQVRTDEKSNEIKAIAQLLKVLSIEGAIITIDAMGCQEKIADTIIDQKADYLLAVKENQKQLYQDIEDEFRFAKAMNTFAKGIPSDTHQDVGHGRIEKRTCAKGIPSDSLITKPCFEHITNPDKWKQLSCVIRLVRGDAFGKSQREFKGTDKPIEKATRYYISGFQGNAEDFQKIIRSHWGIENKLHWSLDVSFSEDASRKRAGNAAQNFAILTKIAINLLKNDKSVKIGIKGKRLKAEWSNQYLLKILKL